MVDAEELGRLLAATALGGRAVETLDFDRLLIRIEPDQVWPAWEAARSVVAASGRWPVAHAGSAEYHDLADVLPNPPDAGRVVAASEGIDPWTTWHQSWRDIPLSEDWVQSLVIGYGLDEAEARGYVDRGALLDDVEWSRLQRRLAAVDNDAGRIEVSPYLTDRDKLWFTPTREATGIVFLTSDSPLDALAEVDYYGGTGPALVAVGREWHARYGAELVAAWGTMLQFVARRRPASVAEAWELAGQHLRLAGNSNADRDDLALALMRTDFWLLHERP